MCMCSYDTSETMSYTEMQQLYTRLAEAIAPHVDLLLVETMSCLSHAKAAVSVAAAFGAYQHTQLRSALGAPDLGPQVR